MIRTVLLYLFISFSFAQVEISVLSRENLSNYFVDINYSFPIDVFNSQDKLNIKYLIYSESNIIIQDSNQFVIDNNLINKNLLIEDKKNFMFNSGNYTIKVMVSNSKLHIENTKDIQLTEISKNNENLRISDIYLFNQIENFDTLNHQANSLYFDKYHAVLNFKGFYELNINNFMHFYYEIYNIDVNIKELNLTYRFFDENNSEIKTVNKQVKINSTNIAVKDFYAVIQKLNDGKYRFEVKVSDGNREIIKNRYIEVKKMKKDINKLSELSKRIDLKRDFYVMKYNLNENDFNLFSSLDSEKQILFILEMYAQMAKKMSFTVEQVIDHFTKLDEFIDQEYSIYYKLTNDKYTSHVAYLLFKYGRPTFINKVSDNSDGVYYEEWEYENLEKGAKFYLSAFENLGFKIIHSTYSKEGFKNYNWQKKILRGKF